MRKRERRREMNRCVLFAIQYDEALTYLEKYHTMSDYVHVKGSNINYPKPFQIDVSLYSWVM